MIIAQNYDGTFRSLDFDLYEHLPWTYGRPYVSELNPRKLYQKLDQYQSHFSEVGGLVRAVGAKVTHFRSGIPFTGSFWITPSRKGDLGAVCVNISARYSDEKIARMRNRKWSWVKFKFIQTLLHETVHRMQYLNGDDDIDHNSQYAHASKRKASDYLATKAEVEAWAHCSYLEFLAYQASHPNITLADYLLLFSSDVVSWETRNELSEALLVFDMNFDRDETPFKKFITAMRRWDRIYRTINKDLATNTARLTWHL